MTEQQPYDVLETHPGFELRRYPAHVLAETQVEGSFEHAGLAGFTPLVRYISAGGVAMTAPVLQDTESAPEPTDPTAGTAHRIAFVMPAGAGVDSLPVPTDTRITIREVDEEVLAAARFSGRWTRGSARRHGRALLSALAAAGLEPTGPLRWARYDPPMTPWFLRRHEVLVPVAYREGT